MSLLKCMETAKIGDSWIILLDFIGNAKNYGNGSERGGNELTVNEVFVVLIRGECDRPRHPPRQRSRRSSFILGTAGTSHPRRTTNTIFRLSIFCRLLLILLLLDGVVSIT